MLLHKAVTFDFLSWKLHPLLLLFMLFFPHVTLIFHISNATFVNSNFKIICLFSLKSYSLMLLLSLCSKKKETEFIWLFSCVCVPSCMHSLAATTTIPKVDTHMKKRKRSHSVFHHGVILISLDWLFQYFFFLLSKKLRDISPRLCPSKNQNNLKPCLWFCCFSFGEDI